MGINGLSCENEQKSLQKFKRVEYFKTKSS